MVTIKHRDALLSYNFLIAPGLFADTQLLVKSICDMYIDEKEVADLSGDNFEGRLYRRGYAIVGSLAMGIKFDAELDITGVGRDSMSVLVQRIDPPYRSRN
ncbi:MAG: hypothetical protein HYT70_02160 [Candidatus Aenigmarchaeota archaeon]|nr:hypothetical protein [Candidatus Aenigmarchaeota archaeon]